MSAILTKPRRILLAVAILASCIGCDQATKSFATQALKNAPPVSLLADTIRLEYALNPGGFLSLGGNLPEAIRPWLFVGFNVTIMTLIAAVLLLRQSVNGKTVVAVSFILAGGIGNLIDRVSNNGLVTDFINIGIGPLRTGIFNIADMAVMFGGIAVVLMVGHEPKEVLEQTISSQESQ